MPCLTELKNFSEKIGRKKLQEQRADELTEFFNSHRAQIKRLDEVRKKNTKRLSIFLWFMI